MEIFIPARDHASGKGTRHPDSVALGDASPSAQIGVSAIKWELKKLGLPFPADRTINQVIKSEGFVKKRFFRIKDENTVMM